MLWILVVLIFAGYYERQWNKIREAEANFAKQAKSEYRLGSGATFDKIAEVYDKSAHFLSMGWHLQWKTLLVHELNINGMDRVLDIATGTGDVAIKIAHVMKDKGKMEGSAPSIIAIDPSQEMIKLANQKLLSDIDVWKGYVKLEIGAAEQLQPFPPITAIDEKTNKENELLLYDKVAISFGVRNFEDRIKGLNEIRRVTKTTNPNGKLAILEFSAPEPTGIFTYIAPIVSNFIYYGIPIIGTVVSDGRWDIYKDLSNSIFNFPSPKDFLLQLKESGFQHCTTKDIFLNTVWLYTCDTYIPPVIPNHNSDNDNDMNSAGAGVERIKKRKAAAAGIMDESAFEL
jgi:demethylmenaquinone methyltransferase / 2-methoxy-6-polyprenyl-1,4-benzoquinol methylase